MRGRGEVTRLFVIYVRGLEMSRCFASFEDGVFV